MNIRATISKIFNVRHSERSPNVGNRDEMKSRYLRFRLAQDSKTENPVRAGGEVRPPNAIRRFFAPTKKMSGRSLRMTFNGVLKWSLAILKKTLFKYPAIIAAYFIYGYYFLSTMQFYIQFKDKNFGGIEILKHFDTVLWMWLLSYVLVRVLELREKLEMERLENNIKHLENEKEITKLKTLKEIIYTLHHEVNNPLAVIYLQLTVLKRKSVQYIDIASNVAEIETASKRIHSVITTLSNAISYDTTESPVGNLIDVHHDR